jgi:hypothetical protein
MTCSNLRRLDRIIKYHVDTKKAAISFSKRNGGYFMYFYLTKSQRRVTKALGRTLADSLGHLTGFQTRGTNLQTCRSSANESANVLQIWIPATLGDIVCVGDVITEIRFLTTDFTYFRHSNNQLSSSAPAGPQPEILTQGGVNLRYRKRRPHSPILLPGPANAESLRI